MKPFDRQILNDLYERTMQHTSQAAGEMEIRPEMEAMEVKLRDLVMKTILDDVNASVILYGYPGSGKTLVMCTSVEIWGDLGFEGCGAGVAWIGRGVQ